MSKRILIVGGGVVGLSTAYYCAQRGHQVTVVDRNPPERDGCSFGNAGLIVPSHFVPLAAPGMVRLGLKWMWNEESPFWIKPRFSWELLSWALKFWRASNPSHVARSAPLLRDLNLASRACYEELAGALGNGFEFTQRGIIVLCKTQHSLDDEAQTARKAHELGLTAEVLDAAATARLEPGIRMNILGSVHYPQDCHLTPHRFMADLKRELERLGARFVWSSEVTGARLRANAVQSLTTSLGELDADEFILCGGAWSPGLGRALGLKLPMQPGKGYSLTIEKPRELPRLGALLVEARVAVTPMSGALRFGGTMELTGLNQNINPVRVRGIIHSAQRYYPGLGDKDFEGVAPWRGLRPCSPDGLPYIGRTGHLANLVVATGHAMMGLSLGPITGKLVSEILSGDKPGIDLRLVSPDRYS